jgi:hypothetical protein
MQMEPSELLSKQSDPWLQPQALVSDDGEMVKAGMNFVKPSLDTDSDLDAE